MAFRYVETNGLAYLADYPFISGNYPNAGSNETCKPVTTPKQFIDDWYYVGTWTWGGVPNETLAAETLVEIGPLTHGMFAAMKVPNQFLEVPGRLENRFFRPKNTFYIHF